MSDAAARQRRCRQRVRDGTRLFQFELPEEPTVRWLLRDGLLSEAAAQHDDRIAEAIRTFLLEAIAGSHA